MSTQHIQIYSAYIIFFFGFLLLPVFFAHAAPNFTVSPFVIDKEVEQRDIVTDTIILHNIGPEPVSLYPSVHGVSLGTEGGIESFTPASMSDRTTSITSWIEISRRGVDLQAGETREVPVTFRINPDAAGGSYHAFIGFAAGRTSDDAKELIMKGTTPGVIVNITIKEDVNEFLKLSKFLISRFVTGREDGDVSYVVENTGDTTIVPQGDILLYNHRGEEVGSIPVNPEHRPLAPKEEATFTASVPTEGLLGKYRALLSIEYGTVQRASVNDTVYFYVLPWKKILIAFVVFLAFALAVSLIVHRRYLKDDDDDGTEPLPLAYRPTTSAAKLHDIDMKK